MRQRIVILFLAVLFVLSLSSCKRQYDMTYSLEDEENIERYVWVSEKYGICFISSELGTVGIMEIDEQEKLIDIGTRPGFFWIYEYNRGCYAYDPETGGWGVNMDLMKGIIHAGQPKYKEGEFSVRVPLEFGQLYAGKKITFTRYEKDAVQPSDFGFDYESWDDLVSQFELVDADTGETVSLDVLK